jgi:hypothetical protein
MLNNSIEQAVIDVSLILDKYEWFVDVCIENRCIIVYATKMDKEVSDVIPDRMWGGHQVKLWFADYLFCKEKYGAKPMSKWNSFVREENFDF